MNRREFLGLLAVAAVNPAVSGQLQAATGLVLDDDFGLHLISPTHPESPARYAAITQRLAAAEALLSRLQRISPWDASRAIPWLDKVHPPAHISSIRDNDPDAFRQALLATAGTLAAVDAVFAGQVRNAFCASRPPGHHAYSSGREEGFCYFNHVAIAARYAQHHHRIKRVLIVDWDYHHGNGTEWAFYRDPSVLFFSTHDQYAYPGTGSPRRKGEGAGLGYNINVHLGCGSGDEAILSAFDRHLRAAVKSFKPELVLVSAGFDSRVDDPLGCFTISDDGFRQLTAWVKRVADQYCDGRLVSVLEGGYNVDGNASAVVAHLEALVD